MLNNGAHTLRDWPDYLAIPAETDAFWPYRITVHNYSTIAGHFTDLKVMLVFARYDHVQAAVTKPHIHQAWDGFYHTCGFWVRMNPDRVYVQSIDQNYDLEFPDNRANREPNDWIYIEDWAFPPAAQKDVWLASVAEMADRVYANDWNDNLEFVFFPVLIDSEDTHVENIFSHDHMIKSQSLLPSFPNPFNHSATIPVQLTHQDRVCIRIYNLKGNLVETIFDGNLSMGYHCFHWQADEWSTGVYICRFQFSHGIRTQKLILLR